MGHWWKEFNWVLRMANCFEDTTHSFAKRKAIKTIGNESVGSFKHILLAITELSMQMYGKMSRQACHAHQHEVWKTLCRRRTSFSLEYLTFHSLSKSFSAPAAMTRFFCCGSYFPGYPCYGTTFHRTYRAMPLNCVVPLGSPLNYGNGCNGYSSLGYSFGGSNISSLGCCYGGSFYRPWGSGSGFGYSTYWWTNGSRPQQDPQSILCAQNDLNNVTVFLPPDVLERYVFHLLADFVLRSWSLRMLGKSPRHQVLHWYSSLAKARCISLIYLNFTSEASSLYLIIALPMYS